MKKQLLLVCLVKFSNNFILIRNRIEVSVQWSNFYLRFLSLNLKVKIKGKPKVSLLKWWTFLINAKRIISFVCYRYRFRLAYFYLFFILKVPWYNTQLSYKFNACCCNVTAITISLIFQLPKVFSGACYYLRQQFDSNVSRCRAVRFDSRNIYHTTTNRRPIYDMDIFL